MGLFTSRDELKRKIARLEDRVTAAQEAESEAKIELSRVLTTYNLRISENDNRWKRDNTALRFELDTIKENNDILLDNHKVDVENKLAEEALVQEKNFKKALKAEFGDKITSLEKENKSLTKENGEIKGKYDGVLLINKVLEKQLDQSNKKNDALVSGLVKAMPEVSAEFGGEQHVNVNTKG